MRCQPILDPLVRSKNTALCLRCGVGTILTGEQRKYNAKIDGRDVCADCKVAEIYGRLSK
jgi:hypothetical protein